MDFRRSYPLSTPDLCDRAFQNESIKYSYFYAIFMSVTAGLLLIIALGIIYTLVGVIAIKRSAPAGYIFLAVGIILLLSVIIKYLWR